MKQANARAQEAKEALEKAHEEHEVLTHAAAQHDELLEQLTSLRISLSQAQVDLAAKEDELLESRALLDRTVRHSLLNCRTATYCSSFGGFPLHLPIVNNGEPHRV